MKLTIFRLDLNKSVLETYSTDMPPNAPYSYA